MKNITLIIVFSVLAIFVIGLGLSNKAGGVSRNTENKSIDNVYMEGEIQVVEILAKGGYSPGISTAKKGVPTIIRFKSKGTFDCSASVRIPALNTSFILKNSEIKDIDIGIPNTDILNGSCSMGMYAFRVNFTE